MKPDPEFEWFECKECGEPFERVIGSRDAICEECEIALGEAEDEENEVEL